MAVVEVNPILQPGNHAASLPLAPLVGRPTRTL
jgi:hypothetical protein